MIVHATTSPFDNRHFFFEYRGDTGHGIALHLYSTFFVLWLTNLGPLTELLRGPYLREQRTVGTVPWRSNANGD